MNKELVKILSIIFSVLLLLTALLSFLIEPITAARSVFGSIWILFLPGFMLTLVFFNKKEIETIEKVVLSFVLSFATVPLFTFYLNLIGIKINFTSNLIVSSVIILSSAAYLWVRKPRFVKNEVPLNPAETIIDEAPQKILTEPKVIKSKKSKELIYICASTVFVLALGAFLYSYLDKKTQFSFKNTTANETKQTNDVIKEEKVKIKIIYSKNKIDKLNATKDKLDISLYKTSEAESAEKNGEAIKYISNQKETAIKISELLSITNLVEDETIDSEIAILLEDDPILRERNTLNLKIENGTTSEGLAAKTKEELAASGYSTIEISNAETQDHQKTTIYYNTALSLEAKRLLADLDKENVELVEETLTNFDLLIILGTDSQILEETLTE